MIINSITYILTDLVPSMLKYTYLLNYHYNYLKRRSINPINPYIIHYFISFHNKLTVIMLIQIQESRVSFEITPHTLHHIPLHSTPLQSTPVHSIPLHSAPPLHSTPCYAMPCHTTTTNQENKSKTQNKT